MDGKELDWLGKARELLARLVERGLHLPEARRGVAERVGNDDADGEALATVTLANIYAAQGHRAQALATLREVASRDPDNAEARELLAQIEAEPERDEASAVNDVETSDVPIAPRADRSAEQCARCTFVPMGDGRFFFSWSVGDTARSGLVVTLVAVAPAWDGPTTSERTVAVSGASGELLFDGFATRATVRAALGLRVDGAFVPIAVAPPLELAEGVDAPRAPSDFLESTAAGLAPIDDEDAIDELCRSLERARAMAT